MEPSDRGHKIYDSCPWPVPAAPRVHAVQPDPLSVGMLVDLRKD
jgi:hypothetical protein